MNPWTKCFAWLPKDMGDGTSVWLQYVEYKWIYGYYRGDYKVYRRIYKE